MKSPSSSINKPAKKSSPLSSKHTFKTTCIASAITTLMLSSGNVLADTSRAAAQAQHGQGAAHSVIKTPKHVMARTNPSTRATNFGGTTSEMIYLGTTNDITVTDSATLSMEDDAIANNVVISSSGKINMKDNTLINNVSMSDTGKINMQGNSSASNFTMTGGEVNAMGRNTITNASISNGQINATGEAALIDTTASGTGYVALSGNASADRTKINGGSLSVYSNSRASNTTLSAGTMKVNATATINTTSITGGTARLVDTAKATYTTISGGSVSLENSAEAKTTTVSGSGQLKLSAQSKADLTQLNGGTMALTGNATASNTTIAGGAMTLANMSKASTTTISSGSLTLSDTAEAVGTNISGGTFNIGGQAVASNTQVKSGGTLNLRGAGRTQSTTVTGNMSVSGNASALDTTVVYGGRFTIDTGTTVRGTRINGGGTMQLAASAAATDTYISAGGNLLLAGNATLSGNTTMSGTTKFTPPAAGGNYSVLTINGDLNGDGTYYMNAHSAAKKGDMIKVTGQANGNNTLFVADSGNEPVAPGQEARLVQIGGGAGSFALQGGTVDVGAFRYKLEQRSKDWVLVRADNPGYVAPGTVSPGTVSPGTVSPGTVSPGTVSPGTVSPGTIAPGSILPAGKPTNFSQKNLSKAANAAVASHAANSVALVAQMNALVKRLGELRMGKDDGGMWTRAYVKEQRLDTSSSRSFEQQVSGTEFGLDKAYQLGENKVYVGGLLGLGRVKQDFNEGVKGKVNSFSAGAYTSLIAPDGSYADAVFKYSRFDNEVDFVDNMGLGVKAEHKNTAYMLNLEVGKRIDLSASWFVEPQLELMAMQINGADYAASNGMQVKQASVRSLQSRIGTLVGHNHKMDDGRLLQTYAKASWINEHEGKSKVSINGTSLDSVLPGSRAEIGVGMIVQAADKHKFHVDLEYTKGNEIKQPVALNVGYRYLW